MMISGAEGAGKFLGFWIKSLTPPLVFVDLTTRGGFKLQLVLISLVQKQVYYIHCVTSCRPSGVYHRCELMLDCVTS